MTAAETILEAGLDALIAHHGERLTWRSVSGVILTNHGEAVTTEGGKAFETGDGETIQFNGIFDSEYQLELPGGAGTTTTTIAVTARDDDLPDAARGDVIERDSVNYYVTDVQPDGLGRIVMLLSRQTQ